MISGLVHNGRLALDIGVDVGGTFTDVVCVEGGARLSTHKVPTTPGRQHEGIVQGIEELLARIGGDPAHVRRVIHGTTVATNAIIERRGARVGILMTAGFEDTLELGRYKRSSNYDIWFDAETPVFLAPKRRRKGVVERLDHTGSVLVALDEESVRRELTALVNDEGVEAIAVCYLFSFENPAHEQRTAEIARELFPALEISLSSEVNPELREYERLCVTAFDAYVRPVVGRYLSQLSEALRRIGIDAPLQVMESRGGIADAQVTVERPSKTIMSGPAAGVMGALYAAAKLGDRDIVSIDIGGTSSDVSLVVGGRPVNSREGRILTYPIRVPMIDVNSIGAGGGSIAWFDSAGGLRVGPRSAGADPGPACYARGGDEATVTDASVVLGYIDPEYFAGGTFRLDPELAHAAVGRVAERLRRDPLEAAWGIHTIVNANMTDQVRVISVGRGHDPRGFSLVLLGGAGSVHGCAMAEALGIARLIVPSVPGVLSAFGLLVSNVEHEQTTALHLPLDALQDGSGAFAQLSHVFGAMDREGLSIMGAQRIAPDAVRVERRLDLRYIGQSYELEVPIEPDLTQFSAAGIADAFDAIHRDVYGQRRNEAREVVNVRTIHVSPLPKPELIRPNGRGRSATAALIGVRSACFGGAPVETSVYDRAALPHDACLDGPAIVQQPDTTVVVSPGWRATLDPTGQIVMTRR